MGWISEKMKVALDESYNDPTNLQGKIQKHQAFEAELMANRKRVDVVAAVCAVHYLLLVSELVVVVVIMIIIIFSKNQSPFYLCHW